jgi:hypothetical protein
MRRCIILIISLLIAYNAFADTYTAVTGDNEVEKKEEVVVKRSYDESKAVNMSMNSIDAEIAVIDAKIAELNARKAALQAIRTNVETEAGKVTLKK